MNIWPTLLLALILAYLIHRYCGPTACPCCMGTGSVRVYGTHSDIPCPRCGGTGRLA